MPRSRCGTGTCAGRVAQRFPRHRAGLVGGGLQPHHHRLGLGQSSLADQPARGFRQPQQHQRDDQPGNAANQEHDLPPQQRHQQRTDLPGHHQPDGEDHLVQHEKPAAAAGFGKLADVGSRDGHLAADADALNEATHQEDAETPRTCAGETYQRVNGGCRGGTPNPAVTLGAPAESQRPHDLAHIAGADHEADFRCRDVPQRHQDRQNEGDRQCVERVEERGTPHDDAGTDKPARRWYLLHARDQGGGGNLGREWRRWRGNGGSLGPRPRVDD